MNQNVLFPGEGEVHILELPNPMSRALILRVAGKIWGSGQCGVWPSSEWLSLLAARVRRMDRNRTHALSVLALHLCNGHSLLAGPEDNPEGSCGYQASSGVSGANFSLL